MMMMTTKNDDDNGKDDDDAFSIRMFYVKKGGLNLPFVI